MGLPKIHKFVLGKYQPNPEYPRYVVDCKLYDTRTTPDIYWSESYNSYVLAEVKPGSMWANRPTDENLLDRYFWARNGQYFQLVSINGAGEVRWDVTKDRLLNDAEWEEKCIKEGRDHIGDGREFLAAARHFGLMPKRKMTNLEATVYGDSQER